MKEHYLSPLIEVLNILTEQGFAASLPVVEDENPEIAW